MARTRKVAVNITSPCDLDAVHKKVVDFLFTKGEKEYLVFPNFNKIDYYICHQGIQEPSQEKKFLNSVVYYSPSENEVALLNSCLHDENKQIVEATNKLSIMFFRSYVNSNVMHKSIYTGAYDCVINYSDQINNYKMSRHLTHYDIVSEKLYQSNKNFIENNLFYTIVICPMNPEVDYSFFVTTQTTFLRVIMFWQFIRLLDDKIWKYNWWIDWKSNPASTKPDKLILPCWLDMQGIYIRNADAL